MDLLNLHLSGSSELFPAEAMEKSSHILHNEAIRKAVSAEKPTCKSSKKLHFSQSTRPWQAAKRPYLPTSGQSSGCPSFLSSSSGSKASSSSSCRGGGKKF